jgi:hypothetical protein
MFQVCALIFNTWVSFKTDKNKTIGKDLSLLRLLAIRKQKHCDIIIGLLIFLLSPESFIKELDYHI